MGYSIQGPSLQTLTGTATISFPTASEQEVDAVVLTILSAFITNTNIKGATFIPDISVDHESLDDFSWNKLIFNIENIVDGISFDIRATSAGDSWGDYQIKYLITYE